MKRTSVILTGMLCLLSIAPAVRAQGKMVGGDISMLPRYEAARVDYKTPAGQTIPDLIPYLRDEAGYNIARVRLFVDPTGATGVVQDTAYIRPLCQRIKAAGLNLLLDFHYSDTWADPKAQWTPAAWTALDEQQLADTLYNYTRLVLEHLVACNAAPDYIQTGNEISYGMLWGAEGKTTYKCYPTLDSNNWTRFISLLTRAGQACRDVCSDARIIIHTERAANWSATYDIYRRLAALDYDIIGLSYYPEWHNDIATLTSTLNRLHSSFPTKPVMIVETGYYNNWYPADATYDFTSTWPASAAGQKAFLDDLVAAIAPLDHVIGLLYWFPEENPCDNRVYEPWYNHGLFSPSTGRAVDALFAFKALRGDLTPVTSVSGEHAAPQGTYTLDGRPVSDNERTGGILIQNGQKTLKINR